MENVKNPQRLPRMPYKGEHLGIIVGLLLGDGSISQKYQNRFTLTGSTANSEYFFWKCKILESLGSLKFKTRILKPSETSYGKNDGLLCDFADRNSIWAYKNFYKNGKRIITWQFIRHLNPYGLALWFGDDGWIVKKDYDYYSISTAAFLEKEQKEIVKMFNKRFGLFPTIQKDKHYYKLYFGGEEGKRFRKLIEPYIHSSVEYKLCQTRIY